VHNNHDRDAEENTLFVWTLSSRSRDIGGTLQVLEVSEDHLFRLRSFEILCENNLRKESCIIDVNHVITPCIFWKVSWPSLPQLVKYSCSICCMTFWYCITLHWYFSKDPNLLPVTLIKKILLSYAEFGNYTRLVELNLYVLQS